jgi:uncharacterized protein
MLATFIRIAALVLLGYTAYLALLFVQQRSMLFPGAAMHLPEPDPAWFEAARWISLDAGFGPVRAFWMPAASGSGSGTAVLYLPGNAEALAHSAQDLSRLVEAGLPVLLLEYPGYGRSAGQPGRESFGEAARLAHDWLLRGEGGGAQRVLAIGRSIGTGASSDLAASRPLAGVVLLAPFTSLADAARRHAVPAFLIRDAFDNRTQLQRSTAPVLILHGRQDEIIPVSHARELAQALPGARLIELDCGHNDCAFFAPDPVRDMLDLVR